MAEEDEEETYELTPKGEMHVREILFRYKRGDSIEAIAYELELDTEQIAILFALGEYFKVVGYEDVEEIPDTPPSFDV